MAVQAAAIAFGFLHPTIQKNLLEMTGDAFSPWGGVAGQLATGQGPAEQHFQNIMKQAEVSPFQGGEDAERQGQQYASAAKAAQEATTVEEGVGAFQSGLNAIEHLL